MFWVPKDWEEVSPEVLAANQAALFRSFWTAMIRDHWGEKDPRVGQQHHGQKVSAIHPGIAAQVRVI